MNKVYGDWAQVKNPAIIDLWQHHAESDDVTNNNQNNESSVDKDDELSPLCNQNKDAEEIDVSDSNFEPEDDDDEEYNDAQILTFNKLQAIQD